MKEKIDVIVKYTKTFFKWLIIAGIVGIVGGLVGSAFHMSIEFVTEFRHENTWVYFLLPISGVVISALYKLSKTKIDTNRVIKSIRGERDIPWIMAPLIFISTVITHFVGGSAGREGAALQLGGSIGYNFGRVCRLKNEHLNIIVMAGMSAVFAALFGTPVTAVFFALEVTSVGIMYYAGLLPCVFSSITACAIASLFQIDPVRFSIPSVALDVAVSWRTVVLSLICAVIALLFCFAIEKCEKYMERFFKNDYLRTFFGGIIILALMFAVGSYDYNGAGMEVISRAIGGEAETFAFAIKIVFTAITIAAGFKGGEIVPSFFIGATFGCVAGAALGLPASLGAAIGFVALFCGVTNCPVASLLLALEVFGNENLTLFVIVCAVSFMFSGYKGLYKSQKIMYSKLETKFINKAAQ